MWKVTKTHQIILNLSAVTIGKKKRENTKDLNNNVKIIQVFQKLKESAKFH